MQIREMRQGDVDQIAEITRIAWGNMTLHKLLEDRHGLIGNRDSAARKAQEVKSTCEKTPSNVIVAVEEDAVVGYATFWVNKDDRVGHVGNNAVDPAFRGRGIGTALVGWVLEHFRREGLRVACVSTLAHDLPAQRVYEKHGFKELGRSVHYSMEL